MNAGQLAAAVVAVVVLIVFAGVAKGFRAAWREHGGRRERLLLVVIGTVLSLVAFALACIAYDAIR